MSNLLWVTVMSEKPLVRFQNIGDADVQYLLYDGEDPPILLLHATGFLPMLWHPIARELCRHRKVIAPYFCDHRLTDPEKGGLSWMLLAEDLCRLCDGLNLESPFLVGHSMGATVMTIAEAMHGPKASGMILIEPIFLPQDFYRIQLRVEDHPLASRSIKRRNIWRDPAAVKDDFRRKRLFKNWDEECLDLYIEHGTVARDTGELELTCSPEKEASLFMGGMGYDPWPMLPMIGCPVWVLEGEESTNRPFVDLKTATTKFQQGTHQLMTGAGHLIPMEKPNEIINLILKHLP
jgi:pimeloyl-ACP methyl ester carboxylesterase